MLRSPARASNGRAAPVARHDFRSAALRLDLFERAQKMLRRAIRGSVRLRCCDNTGRKDDERNSYCSSSQHRYPLLLQRHVN
jgi:hypothetical protein